MRQFTALCALTLPLFACNATSDPQLQDPGDPPPPPVATTTSYLRDVQPIIERSCLGCHVSGGVAPFSFESPADVKALAPAIVGAVVTGRMPPFYASADCNTYQRDPRLSQEEIDMLTLWRDEGAPMGLESEARHAEPVVAQTVRRDRLLDIGAEFDAKLMTGNDNYRCFVMDPALTGDMMITGYEVVPDNRAVVHHVLAYLVAPANVAELEDMDAADPALGYECFSGGVGVRGAIANQIAGWVPGGGPVRLPPGTGLDAAAGSKIVIQIHYNLLAAGNGSTLDRTQLALELESAGSMTSARILPAVKRNLDIVAGDASSTQQAELPLPATAVGTTMYRFTGHMHLLGTQVRLKVKHEGGGETCLLDIPRWDFQWQREYELVTPYVVKRGDRLELTCVYDNSAANQPVVNGEQVPPRDVTWGESSLDEMCMTYIVFTQGGR